MMLEAIRAASITTSDDLLGEGQLVDLGGPVGDRADARLSE